MTSGLFARDSATPFALSAACLSLLFLAPTPGHAEQVVSPGPGSADASAPLTSPSPSVFDHIQLDVGSSDLSGDFGAGKTTNIAVVQATASYRLDGLRLTASAPWMRIDSPGAVFTGIEGTPIIADPEATGVHKVRQGVGDLTLGASYLLPATLTHGVDADLLFRIKAPTATASSHLSTGSADYAFGSTLTKSVGRFSPLVTVFYRVFGTAPMFNLKNGVLTSIGSTYSFSPGLVGLLTYDYAQRASRFISDSHQISASLSSVIPNTPLRLTSFVSGGLSRGAPAVSAGLSLSLRL